MSENNILTNKEESVNLDINFDSISDINLKNTSFYSITANEPLPNDSRIIQNEMLKSKSEKKMDLESVKMLPYYIEKVSQNIKFIDQIINRNNSSGRSHSQSKDKNTNNTSGSGSNKEEINSNSIASIQNIVKKSVDSVHEVLNNKKLNTMSLNNSHGSIGRNHEKDSRDNSSREYDAMNVSQNLSSRNLKIIEERDEDLFSRHSNMVYEPVKKKNLPNLNKANFAGVTKKITINNLSNSNSHTTNEGRSGNTGNTGNVGNTGIASSAALNTKQLHIANSNTITNNYCNSVTPPLTGSTMQNKNKISNIPSITKKTPSQNVNTNSANKKKINPLSVSSPNPVLNKKNKISSINNNSKPNTTITTSTALTKASTTTSTSNNLPDKKKKINNYTNGSSNTNSINNILHVVSNSDHKKTPSNAYTTEPNLTTSTKSNQKIHTSIPSTSQVKDKSLTNKKSTDNLISKSNFNTRKKNFSVDNDGCCCKCHSGKKTNFQSFQKFQSVRKNSQVESAFHTHRNSTLTTGINKLNDLLEVNVKSLTELFYIFNDISSINHVNREKRTTLISPNQSFFNVHSKCNFSELLSLLKNFLREEDVVPSENPENKNLKLLVEKTNCDTGNISTIISLENISARIIQRKWRENKIKKIMYPLMTLDMTHNKLEHFSFFNCNKKEILKLGKVHLYTSLLKSSEKFNLGLSLMNQAAFAWQELMKNNSKIIF